MIDMKRIERLAEVLANPQQGVNPRWRLVSTRDLEGLLTAVKTTRAEALAQVAEDFRKATPPHEAAARDRILQIEEKYKIV